MERTKYRDDDKAKKLGIWTSYCQTFVLENVKEEKEKQEMLLEIKKIWILSHLHQEIYG